MSRAKIRKTGYLGLFVEPDLRATIEAEAVRRDTSMSSTIRALIRAQLASLRAGDLRATAR